MGEIATICERLFAVTQGEEKEGPLGVVVGHYKEADEEVHESLCVRPSAFGLLLVEHTCDTLSSLKDDISTWKEPDHHWYTYKKRQQIFYCKSWHPKFLLKVPLK